MRRDNHLSHGVVTGGDIAQPPEAGPFADMHHPLTALSSADSLNHILRHAPHDEQENRVAVTPSPVVLPTIACGNNHLPLQCADSPAQAIVQHLAEVLRVVETNEQIIQVRDVFITTLRRRCKHRGALKGVNEIISVCPHRLKEVKAVTSSGQREEAKEGSHEEDKRESAHLVETAVASVSPESCR